MKSPTPVRSDRKPASALGTALASAGSVLGYASALLLMAFIASMRFSVDQQFQISALVLILMMAVSWMWRDRPQRRGFAAMRTLMIFLSVTMSLRYLVWRGAETLPLHFGAAALIAGLLLYGAECYCFLVSALGHLPNLKKKNRQPLPLPEDPALLPMVDVYIPTYNEDPELLRTTVIAATQMRYPADKLRVYVLDDGGTAQMCSQPDPAKAAASRQRAATVKAIAERFGATYLSRERNEYAKAGNLNHALTLTQGEFIVALDCDHVPTEDFVEKTLGLFLNDHRLFLVQTPHHFVNPDPLERNLSTFNQSPAENDMFYDAIQPGLDAWGASFFCGSAAMLRRSALDAIGGFAQQTLTEDAETTLRALAHGYTTAYLNLPMVSGLQPETFSGFIQQRARWGQGMLQIFMFDNPWRINGLSLMQRLLFTNFALFWGFPVTRLVMLLMPPIALLFSVQLADARIIDVLAYCIPALLSAALSAQFVYGKVRWPFISYLYEVIQSIHLSASLIHLIRNPREPQFKVTPKGEILEKDFVSVLARPFYVLVALNAVGLLMGIYKATLYPDHLDMLLFVSSWAAIDLMFLLCALAVTFERRQRRIYPRALAHCPVQIRADNGLALPGLIVDASATGAGICLNTDKATLANLRKAHHVELDLTLSSSALNSSAPNPVKLHGQVQKIKVTGDGSALLGVVYSFHTLEHERMAVAIPYGSSMQLQKNLQRRHQRRGILSTFIILLKKAFTRGTAHLLMAARQKIRSRKPEAVLPLPEIKQ